MVGTGQKTATVPSILIISVGIEHGFAINLPSDTDTWFALSYTSTPETYPVASPHPTFDAANPPTTTAAMNRRVEWL